MVTIDSRTFKTLKINCPRCGKPMIMGSVKNKNLNIVQVVKNGINYICVKCVGKTGKFKND